MKSIWKYLRLKRQGGFTLLEASIAAGLSAVILVTLYYAVGEGTDISRDVTSMQDVNRSLNNALIRFGEDIRSARYFYAGTDSTPGGPDVLDKTPNSREITFAVTRNDGTLAWIKYESMTSALTEDTYLIRLSDFEDPTEVNLSYVSHDVASLKFVYYDEDGVETTNLEEVTAVEMMLVIDAGEVSKERTSFFRLRNKNIEVMASPWEFDDERDALIIK